MLFKKLKQAWSNWLNRMANQNKAALGSEPLDCCRVGRENRQKNKKSLVFISVPLYLLNI